MATDNPDADATAAALTPSPALAEAFCAARTAICLSTAVDLMTMSGHTDATHSAKHQTTHMFEGGVGATVFNTRDE